MNLKVSIKITLLVSPGKQAVIEMGSPVKTCLNRSMELVTHSYFLEVNKGLHSLPQGNKISTLRHSHYTFYWLWYTGYLTISPVSHKYYSCLNTSALSSLFQCLCHVGPSVWGRKKNTQVEPSNLLKSHIHVYFPKRNSVKLDFTE